MLRTKLIEELSNKIKGMVSSSPLDDLDRNIHALLQGAFTKLELVSKDEFDVQADLLRLTRDKLEKVQSRLDALELKLQAQSDALHKNNN